MVIDRSEIVSNADALVCVKSFICKGLHLEVFAEC